MSRKHPVIAVTGSSGAGTTTVKRAFENIFRREKISAAVIEGDSLHSLDRMAFRAASAEAAKAGNHSFSHFGPEANHFDKIEETFKNYGDAGMCKRRYYVHSDVEAVQHNKHFNLTNLTPGVFTPWEDIEAKSDLLFYEGLHGLATDGSIDATRLCGVRVIRQRRRHQRRFKRRAPRGEVEHFRLTWNPHVVAHRPIEGGRYPAVHLPLSVHHAGKAAQVAD